MKKLSKSEFDQLLIANRAVFKLIEEETTEGDDGFFSPLMSIGMNRSRGTGKYNFLIFVDAPKNLTGLDTSSEKITQQWELIAQKVVQGESCLQCLSWGQPPMMKYEGEHMAIPTNFFPFVFRKLNEINPEIFSMFKFRNTVGLENVNL